MRRDAHKELVAFRGCVGYALKTNAMRVRLLNKAAAGSCHEAVHIYLNEVRVGGWSGSLSSTNQLLFSSQVFGSP